MKKKISIGVPCYNEEENVLPAYTELVRVTKAFARRFSFEFLFVDNGSLDKTRQVIRTLIQKDRRVVGIFLSRNFGPEASGEAAIAHAKGDAFIYFPCDMQEPPSLIPAFIKKWEEGYDTVVGTYTRTHDVFPIGIIRLMFYKVFKAVSDIDVPVNAGVFSLIDRKVINALQLFPEKFRFFRGLRAWVGFKTAYIPYVRQRRMRGKSSYNFARYFKHAERSFFGFSYVPLDFIVYVGFFFVVVTFFLFLFYLLYLGISRMPLSESITTPLIVAFFGGIQLLALSMVGKYIQVIVDETKSRPMYIVEEIARKKR